MTFWKNHLLSTSLAAVLAVSGGMAQAQSLEVDFSESNGFGVSSDVIQIDNIRVDVVVPNPWDPTHPTLSTSYYTVPFRLDTSNYHLVPTLGARQDESDDSALCADLDLTVSDAFSGMPVEGAVVTVGPNTEFSDTFGYVTFSGLLEGSAEVQVNADGYNSTDQVVDLSCSDPASLGIALNPESGSEGGLATGEVRIILTWGESPSDLDSHLTGPDEFSDGSTTDEDNRFHVAYYNRDEDVADLDLDDTSSFGPETITITPASGTTLRAGLYRYTVHHFSGTGTIASSPATVRLVFSDGSERTFSPMDDGTLTGSGDIWTVFELLVDDSGGVTVFPVDTYGSGSSSIRSTTTGYGSVETGVDFARQPAK